MAKKRYRIEALSEEKQGQIYETFRGKLPSVIWQTLNEGKGYTEQDLLDYIEQNSELPNDLRVALSRGSPEAVSGLATWDTIKAELPSMKDAISSFLEKTKDEAGLSDVQLQERLESFQQPEISAFTPNFNWKNLEEKVKSFLKSEGYSNVEGKTRGIIDSLFETGGSEAKGEAQIKPDRRYNLSEPDRSRIIGLYEQEKSAVIQGTKISPTEDIKRIQDIQTGRAEKVRRTGELESFLTSGEAESEAFASEFLKRQQERGADVLSQELSPNIAQELQRRGLLDSGEFGATISNLAGQIQSGIESEYIQQRESDIALWADLGFKAKFQQLIDADQEVTGQIASERQTIRQGQQQQYQRRESDIQSKFNIDLFRRENERALRDYQTRTTRQQQKQKEQSQAQSIANIAQTATQAVGTGLLLKKFG